MVFGRPIILSPIWLNSFVDAFCREVALTEVLELFIAVFAVHIYGTEDRPRPAFLRHSLRAFAFGGAGVAAIVLAGLLPAPHWIIGIVWALSLITVLMSEHELGKTWLSIAALVTGICLIVAGVLLENGQ